MPRVLCFPALVGLVLLAMQLQGGAASGGFLTDVFNASQLGLVDLPQLDGVVPAFCENFKPMCAAEASQNYTSALAMYEERYAKCGDHGWALNGHAHGYDAHVAFKTTPCGTKLAIKSARTHPTLDHIRKECRRLRELQLPFFVAQCPGCFPKFYHYSNVTGACYAEFINGNRLSTMRLRVRGTVTSVKSLALQGLHVVQTLRRAVSACPPPPSTPLHPWLVALSIRYRCPLLCTDAEYRA